MEHTTQKIKTLFLVAGKSGGHIIPCLTVAAAAKKDDPLTRTILLSTNTLLDKQLIESSSPIDHHYTLPFGTGITYTIRSLIILAYHGAYSCIMSFYYLWRHQPTSLISTGGLVCLPVCLVAFLLRIPITLYELNAVPGKALKTVSPLATIIYVCFPVAQSFFNTQKTHSISYPLRFDPCTITPAVWDTANRTVILITGGSQGSVGINTIMKQWIIDHPPLHAAIAIVHQTGALDDFDWHSFYAQYAIPAHVFDYCETIERWYARADVIVCRAGAGTLFELYALRKPAIIMPLVTTATDHQVTNAYAMYQEHADLFQVIQEKATHTDPLIMHHALQKYIKLK